MPFKYREPMDRVLANSVQEGACWIWIGARDSGGYGKVMVREKGNLRTVTAHRFVVEFALAIPIPRGYQGKRKKVISHKCGNRLCVNPSHLIYEPHKQN